MLVPFTSTDVSFGLPLKHSLYDKDRKLLLARGNVVANSGQFERLLALSAYKLLESDIAGTSAPEGTVDTKATSKKVLKSDVSTKPLDPSSVIRNLVDVIHLSETVDGHVVRRQGKLIGLIDKVSMVVTGLRVGNRPPEEFLGREFNAKMFDGKTFYSFETSVLHVMREPVEHFHLRFPLRVTAARLRKDLRVSTDLEALIFCQTGTTAKTIATTITNLSTSGCGISTTYATMEVGNLIRLAFTLNFDVNDSVYMTLEAIVRYREVSGNPDVTNYGLEFRDVTTDLRRALRAYVYHVAAL
jgi:c-di-GMP-binding flagellar brake protein YcgR